MHKSERHYTFTRRAFIVGTSKIALATSLLGRLYYLQVEQSDHYNTLAEENRIKLKLTPPLRGLLMDRYGEKLALNSQYFQLMITREDVKDIDAAIENVRQYVQVYDEDIAKAKKQMKRTPRFIPVPIKHGLTWKEVSLVEVHQERLPGIRVEEGIARDYPYSEMLAHTLGYVQPIAESDKIDRKYLRLPNFKIGRSGIEKMYDTRLRGEPGVRQVEVNSSQREIRLLSHTASDSGDNMKLTLDFELQKMVYTRLSQEKSAAAVVMDVTTGGILAMVSTPGFDPNLFVDGIDHKSWKALNENKYDILINKATGGQYHPGSAFKMIVAMTGLESGLMGPNDTISCGGGVQFGGHFFHCWKRGGHGARNMRSAIAGSCNTYFYLLSKKVGIDRIAKMAHIFGLGERTELGFYNEKPGSIPSTEWKRKRFNQPWWPGETLSQGIGQGYVTVTPLQLCQMSARLATGQKVMPTFYVQEGEEPTFESLGVKPENLRVVQEGMYQVVNGPGGTAMRHKLKIEGVQMAGKTGTAQVASLSYAKAKQGSGDPYTRWKHQNHAHFTGYAPFDQPKYAISVLIEHGKKSTFAAGITREIMEFLLNLRGPKPHGLIEPRNT